MIRVLFGLVNCNRLIGVVITQCVYFQKIKTLDYMGLMCEVSISPILKLNKYTVFCPGGSSDAVNLQVNKLWSVYMCPLTVL